MKRVLVPDAAPGRHQLTGERFHHLAVVLRVKPDEPLEVFDGRGSLYPATVVSVEAAHVTLELGTRTELPKQRSVTIVQGLPRGEKFELVLQKATELGASAFVPAPAQRSVVKLDDGKVEAKLQRWQRIVEEAARQCGRADTPTVLPPQPLAAFEAPGVSVLVLDEETRAVRLSSALETLPKDAPLALVVGPEGGLAREEVDALTARGAIAVSLGPLILRTETAALAALAVIRHLDGSLG